MINLFRHKMFIVKMLERLSKTSNDAKDMQDRKTFTTEVVNSGKFTFARVKEGELTGVGFSSCSPTDDFVPHIGENIALARATRDLVSKYEVPSPAGPRLF